MRISDWSSDVCSSDLGAEADRPARAIDDIGRGRVGEHEDAEHADAEYDIHHRARAVAVGQLAAIVAENTRRNDVDGGERARRGDIEAVHPYQVARQPKGKRDEGAEYEEVVKREAPDLKVAERLQLLSQGDGLARIAPASGGFRIVARGDQEQDGQD